MYGTDEHRWREQFYFEGGALQTIDIVHHRAHDGQVFYASRLFTALAAGGTAQMLMRVPSGLPAHTTVIAQVGGNCYGYLYEGPTLNHTGTAISARNLNRANNSGSDVLVAYGPSASGVAFGTGLVETLIPGGSGPQAGGGGLRNETEWIFSGNADYLVQVVNATVGAVPVSLAVEFYKA